ncbi:MAG: 3-dehydroquinate synthase [Thaumarchaeota archaeon]|nr:3-dehydroquinate synthase [Nitrososphaerota archaeon]
MEKTATVRVDLSRGAGDKSYDILIREGILGELASGSVRLPDAESYYIVTDWNVAGLYGARVKDGLSGLGQARVELLTFRGGEARKNVATAWALASRLGALGAGRGSVIIALGGGVVGDVAGFVASIYKRGIGYVQIPTTLLAQVDSSIGGKTGVDAPWGKNQIGTFHQPLAVYTDPAVLGSLPRREWINGLAEIVKCAVVADEGMFEKISSLPAGFDGSSGVRVELIVGACRVKADVVSRDEREDDLRAILNYGHTVGHALESSSEYRLSHGACVILGMLAEGWIASQMGIFREADYEKQNELLLRMWKRAGVRGLRPVLSDKKRLMRFALADKKTTSSSLRMSLPDRLGRMHTTKEGSHKVPVSEEAFMGSIGYLRETLLSQG